MSQVLRHDKRPPTAVGGRLFFHSRHQPRGTSDEAVTKPLPPTPSPARRGGEEKRRLVCSPSPLRGGGWGEGFCYSLDTVFACVAGAARGIPLRIPSTIRAGLSCPGRTASTKGGRR